MEKGQAARIAPSGGGLETGVSCRGWGEIGSKPPGQASAQQPIGKQTLPAPIRPPGSQKAGGKSMAELLKASLKGDSALGGQHAASSNSKHPGTSTSQLQETQPLYSGQESEANGWGSLHGLEPVSRRIHHTPDPSGALM